MPTEQCGNRRAATKRKLTNSGSMMLTYQLRLCVDRTIVPVLEHFGAVTAGHAGCAMVSGVWCHRLDTSLGSVTPRPPGFGPQFATGSVFATVNFIPTVPQSGNGLGSG